MFLWWISLEIYLGNLGIDETFAEAYTTSNYLISDGSGVPTGRNRAFRSYPALKRRAIVKRPGGRFVSQLGEGCSSFFDASRLVGWLRFLGFGRGGHPRPPESGMGLDGFL